MAPDRPVLIVSHLFEPGVNRVIEMLDRMDVAWRRFNCEDFPLLVRMRTEIGDDADRTLIDTEGAPFALDEIRSVWHRRLSLPALPRAWTAKDRQFVVNEIAAMLEGTLFESGDVFAVNDRAAERRASNKLRQLRVARACGLAIPETLVTNDRAELDAFRERIGAPLIFKPVSGFAPRGNDFVRDAPERFARWGPVMTVDESADDDVEIVFAQLLDEEKMTALGALALCPVVFQRFIPKTADIRVTIVGDTMFACRIHSQELPTTRVDFRRMTLLPDLHDLRHELCTLPAQTVADLRALMARLGLVFGCVDLVEEASGALTFLEVNASGQWMWIEHFTGAPITERLAQMLAAAAA